MATECILFDLGGVLVELREAPVRELLCHDGMDPVALVQIWGNAPAVREFETGRIGFETYYRSMRDALGVAMDEATFREAHARFLGDPFPGVMELVAAVRRRFRTALLSNTNAVHVAQLNERSGILQQLDQLFLSHQTGHYKPEPAAYTHVVESLGIPAETILFLDDKPGNITAARAAGMRAEVTAGPEALRERLRPLLQEGCVS